MRTQASCPFCKAPTTINDSGARVYACGTFIDKLAAIVRYVRGQRCN